MFFASQIRRAPHAFDPELGADAAQGFDAPPELTQLIQGTAGCSPYLRSLILRHRDWLNAAFDMPIDQVIPGLIRDMAQIKDADLKPGLRQLKGRMAVFVALADLGGVWPLEQVTGALTAVADAAVDRALTAMVAQEIQRGKLRDTGRPAGGVAALAMGKMGAAELNYSSDIDLIVLFDGGLYPEDYHDARAALVRATRRMAGILNDITADGYVFRTDLRLRPDASVTPVCLSMDAAETYYESVGRTWERAAYIKARAAAGDLAAGQGFLDRLTPFVWRKHLDFAAIQDAHDMRLAIRAHKGLFGPITLPGHNLKLGRGGIREIEFFTQTRQLISGGRDPDLRVRGTVPGLAQLAQKGWITPEAAQTLTRVYRSHREVEHRVQMIGDAQTHSLPNDPEGLARLAAFMGQDQATLERALRDDLEQVHALTEDFFAPKDPKDPKHARAQGTAPAPELSERTASMVSGWYSYPALRSARAVEIFDRLKPDLLARLGQASNPDQALEMFDLFLSGLPAGVQLFSLFEANTALVDLVIDITTTAPALAHYLARNAQVFDAVVGGAFFDPWPGLEALTADLTTQIQGHSDYERQLDAARRWHKEWHFRIGTHHLRGLVDAATAGRHYADLAQAVLAALWPPVVAEFARKHGPPPGRGAAVLGMGSLGASQLSATSDLDLILIYDAPGVEMSDGRRPLATRSYFARLTQAYVTALAAQTGEGTLYEVDMRLRPSGRQGPVATSWQAFQDYQQSEAWTWEHLALTRARRVAGSAQLGADVETFRDGLIAGSQPPATQILTDVSHMRDRLHQAWPTPGPLEAKRGPGLLMEIELIGQTACLLAGRGAAPLDQQLQIGAQIGWLSPADCATLTQAAQLLWTVQAAARLLGGSQDLTDLSFGAQAFLERQCGVENTQALAQTLAQTGQTCAEIVASALAAPPKAP